MRRVLAIWMELFLGEGVKNKNNYNNNNYPGPVGTGGSEKVKSSNDDDTLRDGS